MLRRMLNDPGVTDDSQECIVTKNEQPAVGPSHPPATIANWKDVKAWYRRGLDRWREIPAPVPMPPAGLACGTPRAVEAMMAKRRGSGTTR